MMYNDVDDDVPSFNDTIDGEEISLFSNAKTSFSNEDGDDHQHHEVAGTSSSVVDQHVDLALTQPVNVDELLPNSEPVEQPPKCDQSENLIELSPGKDSELDLSEKTPEKKYPRPSIGQWSSERKVRNMSVKTMVSSFEKKPRTNILSIGRIDEEKRLSEISSNVDFSEELDLPDVTPMKRYPRQSIGQWSTERRARNMSVKSLINSLERKR